MAEIISRTVVVSDVVSSVECDNCKKIISADDDIEFGEVVKIRFSGGFGSVWGDGSSVSIDLCQNCSLEIFKDIAIIK